MSSIFRALAGRTSKGVEKKENVKAQVDVNALSSSMSMNRDPMPNTSEDDLFSGLDVNNSMEGNDILPCYHLHEIQDLDITVGEDMHSIDTEGNSSKLPNPHHDDIQDLDITVGVELQDDCDNAGPSAFSFMNENFESKPHKSTENTPVTTRPKNVKPTENTHVASRPKNAKKKRSVKPGFANKNVGDTCSLTSETSDTSNTSDKEILEDICLKPSSESEENQEFIQTNDGDNESNKINEIDIPNNSKEDCNLESCTEKATTAEKEKENKHEYINQLKITNEGNDESIKTNVIDNSNNSQEDCSLELCTEKATSTEKDKDILESIAIEETQEHVDTGQILTNNSKDNLSNIETFENLETNTADGSHLINPPKKMEFNDESHLLISDGKSSDLIVENTNIKETQNCNLEISEQDRIMAKLEFLQSQEKTSREAVCSLVNQQKELVSQWKSEHLDENSICLKVNELRQMQIKLESNEEYDEAGEINKTITDLMSQCDNNKYQYPLCDEQFLSLMKDYENLCSQQKSENEVMLKEYKIIKDWFEEKNDEDDKIELKKLNEMTLLLKEKKLKVERDRSHKSLDKEHLIKSEIVLTEEINKQTKELNDEKDGLLEKKTIVQGNIEELTAKLVNLQQQEHDLTVSMEHIDSKLQNIIDEFQPRIDHISSEKEIVNKAESRLILEFEELAVEEKTVISRYVDISNQKEKKQETISDIESHIEKIQNENPSSETEIFSFLYSLDFTGLQLNDDVEYVISKEQFESLKLKLRDITNKVFADEGGEKRLQRSLNDLEAQLSELQKLKQVHVKERNYRHAQMTSDDINSLTSEGEKISLEAVKLTENIKLQKIEIRKLNIEVEQTQKKFEEKEITHDQTIISKLRKMNIAIENLLSSSCESWAIGILQLQLDNNNIIIQDLLKKHPLFSECNEDAIDIDIEDVKNSLEGLEGSLKIAESEEDWERAEEINTIIEEKKKLFNLSL